MKIEKVRRRFETLNNTIFPFLFANLTVNSKTERTNTMSIEMSGGRFQPIKEKNSHRSTPKRLEKTFSLQSNRSSTLKRRSPVLEFRFQKRFSRLEISLFEKPEFRATLTNEFSFFQVKWIRRLTGSRNFSQLDIR